MADLDTSKNSLPWSGTAHGVVDTSTKVAGIIIMPIISSVGWSGCLILRSFSRSATCVSYNSLNVGHLLIDDTVANIAVSTSVLYVAILILVCFSPTPRALYETCYLSEVPVDILTIIVDTDGEYLIAS